MFYGALFLAELVLLVYCVLDIVATPSAGVRTLPKLVWAALVVLVPLVGGVGWLLVGRPVAAQPSLPAGRAATYDRPARAAAPAPDDDEAFLRGLRTRIQAQRAQAERARADRAAVERSEAERESERRSGDTDPGDTDRGDAAPDA